MKTLHYINFCALIITICLFINPVLGMLAMMPLGIIQLLVAGAITINYYRKLDKKKQSLLLKYWLCVIIDLIGIAIYIYYYDTFCDNIISIPLMFFFPACIAIYFAYTTYSITKYPGHANVVFQH